MLTRGAAQAVPHRKGQFNAEKDEHASVQRESDEFPYGIRYKVRPGDIAAYSHTVIAEQKPCGNNRYYAGNVYILRKDIREKGEEKFNGNTCCRCFKAEPAEGEHQRIHKEAEDSTEDSPSKKTVCDIPGELQS